MNNQQVAHAKIRHRQESGAKDLFKKQNFLQGLISIFFLPGTDNMQNTPIFQLVLCIIQACLGLNSLDFAYVMLVVWLCFRYTTLEAFMRRNDEIRQRNTKS